MSDPDIRWLARHVEEVLNRLLALRPGWDGHRARPVTFDAVNSAVRVLFPIAADLPLAPQLFPLVDGGVQVEWHAGSHDIEIEVDGGGAAHVLATDATGAVLLDGELTSGSEVAARTRLLVGRLADRVAGAAIGS